jgi:hypothetical protein
MNGLFSCRILYKRTIGHKGGAFFIYRCAQRIMSHPPRALSFSCTFPLSHCSYASYPSRPPNVFPLTRRSAVGGAFAAPPAAPARPAAPLSPQVRLTLRAPGLELVSPITPPPPPLLPRARASLTTPPPPRPAAPVRPP